VIYTSKWLNALLIEGTSSQIVQVLQLPFVVYNENIQRVLPLQANTQTITHSSNTNADASSVLYNKGEVLGLNQMNDWGYKGAGIHVAVFDSGFEGVDTIQAFKKLFDNQRIQYTYDLETQSHQVFYSHDHGTAILSVLAADAINYKGYIPEANYYLFRTELAASESPIEEFYWLKAAELADSLGVDLVQSSLGYTTFDQSQWNHQYKDLDGKTTIIARASQYLWNKGVLVVNSAGNDGGNLWKYISTPADGIETIAVGSIDQSLNRALFSSIGPTADGRIKPDVVAPGTQFPCYNAKGTIIYTGGTSLSAPLVTSLLVGLKQCFPNIQNRQLKTLLTVGSSNYLTPNNEIGYGYPSFTRIIQLKKSTIVLFPNPSTESQNELVLMANEPMVQVDIYNDLGSVVFSKTFAEETFVTNLSIQESIQQGIFFVSIYTKNGITIIKWIHL
jgi:subtilisin family serine protease